MNQRKHGVCTKVLSAKRLCSSKSSFLVLLLSVVWVIVGCGLTYDPSVSPSTKWVTFRSETYDFNLKYPATWEASKYPRGYKGDEEIIATIIAPGLGSPSVSILRKETTSLTLKDTAEWGKMRIFSNYEDNVLGELETIKLESGQTILARTIRSETKSPTPLRFRHAYIVRDYDAIIIQLRTLEVHYNNVIVNFEEMVQSFRVSNWANTTNRIW